MQPVSEPDNHEKGNKGVFESKGKGVGGAGKDCPEGVTPAETWLLGSRLRRPWRVVIGPVLVEPGGPLGPARALRGHSEARRARVFVSLGLSAASPTPSAVPPLTPE